MPRVEPARFQTMSPAEAVLRYAGDFIPSWAGAISIDLMPAVLVLILCVVHAAIRREGLAGGQRVEHDRRRTGGGAADGARGRGGAAHVAPGEAQAGRLTPRDAAAAAADENVTSLSSARHTQVARHVAIVDHVATLSCLAGGQSRRSDPALDFPQHRWRSRSPCSPPISPACNGWIGAPDPPRAGRGEAGFTALDLPSIVPSILAPLLPGGDKRLMPLPQPDGALAKPMTFELVGGGKLMATGTITPGISRSVRRRGRQARRLHQDRGAEFAGRFGHRCAGDGPADPREEIRHRSRGRQILRLVLSAGVRRRRRAPRRRQGRDRRASGGGDGLGGERPRRATR